MNELIRENSDLHIEVNDLKNTIARLNWDIARLTAERDAARYDSEAQEMEEYLEHVRAAVVSALYDPERA